MSDTGDAGLVEGLSAAERRRNGVPDDETMARMERAAELVQAELGDVAHPGGFRWSVCGPGWSSDLDVHVRSRPEDGRLTRAGWLDLGPLLGRIGSPATGRWAVREHDRVLAPVDLHDSLPPDPVAGVVSRAHRRGEVRLREVLELRCLAAEGHVLPVGEEVVEFAAKAEASLGGSALAAHLTGPPEPPPVALGDGRLRRASRRVAGPLRSRRFDVAMSGVDGSGKSSLARAVADELRAAGVPVTVVWTRPGLHVDFLRRPAGLLRRLLGHPPEPGLRRVAEGGADSFPGRRGALGWGWSLFVTAAFLVAAHRQRLAGRGVILYDRHLMDALATLDVAYPDTNRRLHEMLVRRLLPTAAVTFYLDVDADTAVARKPDDIFRETAVARQLDRYTRELPRIRELTVIDGRASREPQARQVLDRLLAP